MGTLSSDSLKQCIQLGTALAIIAEHLYLVWRHKKFISPPDIPSTITSYQQLPTNFLVRTKIEDALTIYSESINVLKPEEPANSEESEDSNHSIWRNFNPMEYLPKMKVRRAAKRAARREAKRVAKEKAKEERETIRIQNKKTAQALLEEAVYDIALANRLDKANL
ncbi:hypothetical protein BDZ94DRAFT_1259145 [Collybia nuda]|uniref:Uncharacterized protein n=1 Tax=Collybia nuda TaxID=64659 RepID=A0A9P5Y4W9_9AGAR|nr:hypothetical protein BDZ94DRAFT_1259145 [Collybia nuda]